MARPAPAQILIVTTSTPAFEKVGYRTGLWLSELTHFHDVVTEAGHEATIASVAGGQVPLDPTSLATAEMGPKVGKRYEDPEYMALLDDTVSVAEVAGRDWDAVYVTGGHGVMFDLPNNPELAGVLARTLEEGRIVSAVCHGPSAFIGATLSDGTPLIKGRKVTGFSWPEEKLAQRDKAVPFRLDEKLKAEGASYTKALRPFVEKVVVDGNLVTGQNPGSAEGTGKAVVKLLKNRKA